MSPRVQVERVVMRDSSRGLYISYIPRAGRLEVIRSRLSQRILELALAHLGTAGNMPPLRLLVEIGASRPIVSAARSGRPAAASGRAGCVAASHCTRASAAAARPDSRLAFSFLLRSIAACFLAFGLREILTVLLLALVFRGTCLV